MKKHEKVSLHAPLLNGYVSFRILAAEVRGTLH